MKEPVRLRFKELANGNRSIILDIYQGADGKRIRETTGLYLIPERKGADKAKNDETLRLAQHMQAQRIQDINNQKAGIKVSNVASSTMLLEEWLQRYKDKLTKQGKYTKHIDALRAALIAYRGNKVKIKDVDKPFCLGFMDFIVNTYRTAKGKPIAKTTAHNYYRNFSIVLKAAVVDEVIPENPFGKIDKSDKIQKAGDTTREHLTMDEVKKLAATPCSNEQVKRAFLFCVQCGLRYSDVSALTWGHLFTENGRLKAAVVMQKTKRPIEGGLPLSAEAQRWLPERDNKCDEDKVFTLPRNDAANNIVRKWATAAGIKKRTTFHVSRHTCATLLIGAGVDVYVVSKIVGHKDVATTQIYARVMDENKQKAVDALAQLF